MQKIKQFLRKHKHGSLKEVGLISAVFVGIIGVGLMSQSVSSTVEVEAESLMMNRMVEEIVYTVELNDENSYSDIIVDLFEHPEFLKISEIQPGIYTDDHSFLDLTNINILQLGEQEVDVHIGKFDPTSKQGSLSADFINQGNVVEGVLYNKTITINVVDTTAPVITLSEKEVTLEFEEAFDASAYLTSVVDNSTVAITATIDNPVVTTEAGDYTVTYRAVDPSGNVATSTLFVSVEEEPEPEPEPEVVVKPTTGTVSGNYAPITNVSGINGMLTLINNERIARGLSPMYMASASAQQAANVRAQEAASFVSHTRPNGTSYTTALTQFGVSFNSALEVLTYSGNTVADGFSWWMNSPSHRNIIMSPYYSQIAIGYYNGMWCAIVIN